MVSILNILDGPQLTILGYSLTAPVEVGVIEAAAIKEIDVLTASMSVGLLESATVTNDHLSLVAAQTIGLESSLVVENDTVNLASAQAVGLDVAVIVENDTLSLVSAQTIGATLAATIQEIDSIIVALSIGVTASATIKEIDLITAAESVGVDVAAMVTHDHLSLVAAESVGLIEAATLAHNRLNVGTVAASIGLTESATIKEIDLITASMSIGVTEAATLAHNRLNVGTANESIGVTEAATVTTKSPPVITAIGSNWTGGGNASFTTTVDIPAGNLIIIAATQDSTTMGTLTVNGVSATAITSNTVSAGVCAGLYYIENCAHVPSGSTVAYTSGNGGGQSSAISGIYVTNMATSSSNDTGTTTTGTQNTSSGSVSVTSGTPSVSGNVYVGCCAVRENGVGGVFGFTNTGSFTTPPVNLNGGSSGTVLTHGAGAFISSDSSTHTFSGTFGSAPHTWLVSGWKRA